MALFACSTDILDLWVLLQAANAATAGPGPLSVTSLRASYIFFWLQCHRTPAESLHDEEKAFCCRVARFPGLLLQRFQEIACAHMAALQQRLPAGLRAYSDNERAIAIAALMQLLVCTLSMKLLYV